MVSFEDDEEDVEDFFFSRLGRERRGKKELGGLQEET